jgi:Flp pilus assembly protein CpaB
VIARRLRRRPTAWFAIAAVLAVAAGLITMRAAAVDTPTAAVIVAAEPLAVGTRLDDPESVLALARVPEAGVLPGMARSFDEVRGRTVAVPISGGEPLTQAGLGGAPGLAPEPLAAGERALSVPAASAGAAAAVLVPGARVDVVASAGDGAADARVVVADAEVIAQTTAPGVEAGSDGGAILLRVGERDALRLTAALDRAGGVRLLPRPAGDAGVRTP